MTWADQEIIGATCHGTLEIDGLSMNREAWAVLNNWVWWQPANVRGEDNIIPGTAGVLPNRRRRTATQLSLELLIIGTCEPDGTPVAYDDWQTQLAVNNEWLDTYIFTPPVTLEGTREAVLTLPDGSTRTGDIHILNVTYGVTVPPAILATVEVSIPGGQLGAITTSPGS